MRLTARGVQNVPRPYTYMRNVVRLRNGKTDAPRITRFNFLYVIFF
jgi:hypothetical protein